MWILSAKYHHSSLVNQIGKCTLSWHKTSHLAGTCALLQPIRPLAVHSVLHFW